MAGASTAVADFAVATDIEAATQQDIAAALWPVIAVEQSRDIAVE
jgi:hypothetical protein